MTSMRIDNNGFDKRTASATSSSAAADTSVASGRAGKYDNRDVVALSDLGSLWSRVNGGSGSDRAERLSRLTQQYRAGSYTVDTAALTEALITGAFEG
jgi:anti-sigma28 factor (negative regulator of flagellin synthesis)